MPDTDPVEPEDEDAYWRSIEVRLGAGQLDGHLVDLLEAIQRRINGAGPTTAKWTLTWEGEVFREDEMTLDEVMRAEELSGSSWAAMKPMWKGGTAAALLRSFLEHRLGYTKARSAQVVGGLKVEDVVDMIGNVEVPAPKADSGFSEDETSS